MYVNKQREASVYNLSDVSVYGLTSEIKLRLQYTIIQLGIVLKQESTASKTLHVDLAVDLNSY